MKTIYFLILLTSIHHLIIAQNWTNAQVSKANTAKDIEYLTTVEKEAIMYINLCRLYPKLFVTYELENYFGPANYGDDLKNSNYRKSLIAKLNSMKAVGELIFDPDMYENAKCLANEQAENGTTGHNRTRCSDANCAECCSYGMDTGKDIALQWLIDDKVPSLGHRINCLNGEYKKIGLSVNSHKIYGTCAVANMIW